MADLANAPDVLAEPPVPGRLRVPKMERPMADAGNPVLAAEVMEALRTVRDPELPVNLVDLGLIYDLMVRQDGLVYIEMTLTTPACPVAGSLPGQVQQVVSMVPGVSVVLVNLVWSPPWTQDRMGEAAKLELGLL
jgi:FeS assembly SUF system protein